MKKCPICKNKGVVYTPNIRIHGAIKQKIDIGYWDVCTCVKSKQAYNSSILNRRSTKRELIDNNKDKIYVKK